MDLIVSILVYLAICALVWPIMTSLVASIGIVPFLLILLLFVH